MQALPLSFLFIFCGTKKGVKSVIARRDAKRFKPSTPSKGSQSVRPNGSSSPRRPSPRYITCLSTPSHIAPNSKDTKITTTASKRFNAQRNRQQKQKEGDHKAADHALRPFTETNAVPAIWYNQYDTNWNRPIPQTTKSTN